MKEPEKPERKPTDVERKMLKCWHKMEAKLGRAPKLKELRDALEYTHNGAVKDVLDRLVRQGWMKSREIIPMQITEKGRRWLR